MSARVGLAPLAVALALVVACGEGGEPERAERPPPVSFETGRVRVETASDTLELAVEIAESEAQRTHGLMDRERLPEGSGMLFLFPEPRGPEAGFWMYRTKIPLDIAFLDEEGRIVAIRRMEPCASPDPRWCPSYAPGAPYSMALEVPAGWLERHGVEAGDRVVRTDAAP